jgi:hypothetical protein
MSESQSGDYKVGKGRPPKGSQFKPGHSGNPKGRRKGARNLASDLAEELSERVQVREGGRQRALSKQRAFLKALFAKAMQGDARAASLLVGLMAKLIKDEPAAVTQQPLSLEDQALLDAFVRRRSSTETAAPVAPETPND